jgi:hypothetical protein
MPAIIAGVILALLLILGVNSVSLLGHTCYFIGPINSNSACISPIFYFVAWAVAAGLILIGLAPVLTAKGDASQHQSKGYDKAKWEHLVQYDPDVAAAVKRVSPLGNFWIDEFAKAYLVLNDKQYLEAITSQILARAQKTLPPLPGQELMPFTLTQLSIDTLHHAKAKGYDVEFSATEKCVVVRKAGVGGKWYLGSNHEIEGFGKEVGLG